MPLWKTLETTNWAAFKIFLPAKNTENQIEHKEGSDHDERNEECPVKDGAKSIVGLRRRRNSLLKWLIRCWAAAYPVEYRSPALHGDALREKWCGPCLPIFMIITWNTVNIARMMLSIEVMPLFGPSHFSKQTDRLALININNVDNEADCRQSLYYIARYDPVALWWAEKIFWDMKNKNERDKNIWL